MVINSQTNTCSYWHYVHFLPSTHWFACDSGVKIAHKCKNSVSGRFSVTFLFFISIDFRNHHIITCIIVYCIVTVYSQSKHMHIEYKSKINNIWCYLIVTETMILWAQNIENICRKSSFHNDFVQRIHRHLLHRLWLWLCTENCQRYFRILHLDL